MRGRVASESAIGDFRPSSKRKFLSRTVRGQIVVPRSPTKFGWNPIFLSNGFDKTYGQMTMDEGNAMSHRMIAVKKFKEDITSRP
jgi:inosine/xanthosine triphosphate pyrophosphatase family protein